MRTICVGGISKSELLSQLESARVRLNQAAQVLFADDRFTSSPVGSLVEVVELPVASLGFRDGATFDEIVEQTSGARP